MMKRLLVFPSLLAFGFLHPNICFTTAFSTSLLSERLSTDSSRIPLLSTKSNGYPGIFTNPLGESPISRFLNGINARSKAVASRLDTLNAAGFYRDADQMGKFAHQSSIGIAGHSGLLLASTVLVMLAKAFWKTVKQSGNDNNQPEEVTSSGPMDRCPWPFIFSHDPIQGIKDPPTWILITWFAMWRIVKASRGNIV